METAWPLAARAGEVHNQAVHGGNSNISDTESVEQQRDVVLCAGRPASWSNLWF